MSPEYTARMSPMEALQTGFKARLPALVKDRVAERLWARDASLWPGDPAAITARLGWLDAPDASRDAIALLRNLAEALKRDGVTRVLLLGMGGSSLFPRLLQARYGPAEGYPALTVLDTTDPAEIAAAWASLDPVSTAVLVASKSGTTAEVDALHRLAESRIPRPDRFMALTDPGTPLETLARTRGFGRILISAPDVGGRFSALSAFGLAPMALLGRDPMELLLPAQRMAEACRDPGPGNPGLALGALLGEAALAGAPTLALDLPPEARGLGAWIEQLVAESTGKDGKGLLPLPDPGPARPGPLRVGAGLQPLGAECFLWSFATAVAGHVLGINPFDEPDVAESKRCTASILATWTDAKTPEAPPLETPTPPALEAFLKDLPSDHYLALLAYAPEIPPLSDALTALRDRLAARGRAVTLGYGPRYLHATGQFHKGGHGRGAHLILLADDAADLPIPGRPYGFSGLKRAQALGDLEALRAKGRRVLALRIRDRADLDTLVL